MKTQAKTSGEMPVDAAPAANGSATPTERQANGSETRNSRRGRSWHHRAPRLSTLAARNALNAVREVPLPQVSRNAVEPPPEIETDTQDIELIVAIFRTLVLLVALLAPRLFYPTASYNIQMIWLAAIAGIYNVAVGFAYLAPSPFGMRRHFIVAMDMLLITLWIQLSDQWELFPLYYVVVVVAAMWFRVFGGVVAALFCNFFFLLLWARAAGSPGGQPLAFSTTFALNVALLLLIACLVGSVAEAQERERTRRLEGQMLVANYQREIDLATQMQPLLVPSQWVSTGDGNSPITTLRFAYNEPGASGDSQGDGAQGSGTSTQNIALSDNPPAPNALAPNALAPNAPAPNVSGENGLRNQLSDGHQSHGKTPTEDFLALPGAPDRLLSDEVLNRELEDSELVDVRPLPPMLDRTLQMGAAMRPARSFGGGDYFDIIPLSGGRTALCIADVSGKSVRAQARLPLLKYSLRALAPLYKEPDALVKRLNETLAPDLQSELFIGLCYVVLDPRRGQLTWCNAGHIAPLLISSRAQNTKQGDSSAPEITLLETNGPALGPFPEIGYSEEKLPWRPGDRLLMFTDGLSDALSYGGSEDGEEQIRLTSLAINPEYWSEPDSIAQRFVNLASAALEYTDSRLLNLAPLRRSIDAGSGATSGRRDDITVVAACYSEASQA
ncbi:MAG TPA: PP2C family protein-serine/threonine phosphatase [Abditibacteriaceae bacterium]|jgi:hypothetical protein